LGIPSDVGREGEDGEKMERERVVQLNLVLRILVITISSVQQ